MDPTRWKFILYEWIKSTKLLDVSGNLEHIDAVTFYQKFCERINSDSKVEPDDLVLFLNAHFPDYEILYGDSKEISSQDFMYIYSLLLYFSCVHRVDVFFQKCCRNLDAKFQAQIAKFFGFMEKSFDNNDKITKDLVRKAIREATPLTSPALIPFLNIGSPIKTPIKLERSPPTPNKAYFNEKMKELQSVKAQLDSERYERNILESDVKQNEEKIQALNQERRKLYHELQELRAEISLSKENENLSPNKKQREDQIRHKLQKEITSREELILDLKMEKENLVTKTERDHNRILFLEKEILKMKEQMKEFNCSADDMQEELQLKNEQIQNLQETNSELQAFISETRSSLMKDSSSDCLDFSYNINHTVGFNSTGSGENLGKSVIDLQLKEKEIENEKLKSDLESLTQEKDAVEISKIALEQKIISLETQMMEQMSNNDKLSTEIESLKTLLEAKNQENEKLTIGIQKTQTMVADFQQMISTISSSLEASKVEVQTAMEQTTAANTKLIENEDKIKSLELNIEQLEADASEKLSKINALSNEITDLKLSHENVIEKLNEKRAEEIKTLCAARQQACEQIESKFLLKVKENERVKKLMEESYQSKMHHLSQQNEELLRILKSSDDKNDSLETLVEKIEREKSNLMIALREKQEEIEFSSRESNAKMLELSEKISSLEQIKQQEAENATKVLDSLKLKCDTIKQLEEDLFEIRKTLEEMKASHDNEICLLSSQKSKMEEGLNQQLQNANMQIEQQINSSSDVKSCLEAEISQLTSKLNESEEKIKVNREEISKVENLISESHEQVQLRDGTIDDMTKKISIATAEIELLKHEITTKNNAILSTKQQLENSNFQFEKANIEKRIAYNHLIELQKQLKSFEDSLTSLNTEKQLIVKENNELKQLYDTENLKCLELTSTIAIQTEALNKMKEECEQHSITISELVESKSKLKMELDETIQNRDDLNKTIEELEHSIECFTKRISDGTVEKLQLESAIANHESHNLELVQQLKSSSLSVEALTAENASLKTLSQQQLSSLQNAEASIISSANEIEDLKNQAAFNATENRNLQSSIEELQKQMESLTLESDEHMTEKQELLTAKASLETKIANLDDSLKAREELLNIFYKQESETENQILELKELIESLKLDTDGHLNEISSLKQLIADKETEVDKIALEKNVLTEEKEMLIRKNAIIESEVQDVKDITVTKDKQIDQLKSQLDENTIMISGSEKSFESFKIELKDVNERSAKERQEASNQISSLNKKIHESEELIRGVYMNIDELKDQNSKLKSDISKAAEEKLEMNSTIQSANEKLANLRNDIIHKETQITDLEAKNASLRDALQRDAAIKVAYDRIQLQYNILKEHADDAEHSLQTILAEKTQLLQEQETNLETIDHLSNDVNQKSSDLLNKVKAAEDLYQQTLKQFEESQAMLMSETAEKENLAKQIRELEELHKKAIACIQIDADKSKSELLAKESNVLELVKQIDEIKIMHREKISSLELQLTDSKHSNDDENSRIKDLLKKLDEQSELSKKVQELELLHKEEQEFNNKLNRDQQIILAKLIKDRQKNEENEKNWAEERMKLEAINADERLTSEKKQKEIRLEMEGKLEKMKEKMITLHNEEISRRMQKNDDKINELRSDAQKLMTKIEQLQQHNGNLTKQLHGVNELKIKYKEIERDNEFMRSKIRFIEKMGGMSIGGSIGMGRHAPATTPQINGANLRMEDEEGEEFNNTYLVDLKSGGGSEISLDKRDVYSALELQKRNSMYPQHMRGSYAVINMDKNIPEDEMKDGAMNLDDSEASLLHGHNQNRKKQTTSYRRPGPPTPNKNAGRISLGGNDIQYTNILKDATNMENAIKKPTPGRFKSMLSSMSSKHKDENSPRRRLSFFKKK